LNRDDREEYAKLKESLESMRADISKFTSNKRHADSRTMESSKTTNRALESTINSKLPTQRTMATAYLSPKCATNKKKNCGTCNLLLSQGISAVHCKRHTKK
jgi:hypothetical protein